MEHASKISAKIALVYALVGAGWILFSDELLVYLVHDPFHIKQISIYKGSLYVVATAIMLYLLIKSHMTLLVKSEAKIKERNRDLASTEDELRRQIREQKKTASQLDSANQRLSTLFNASPLAIVALDTDGRVTKWNRAAELMFGWMADEIKGEHYPLVPEEDLVEEKHFLEKTLQGEVLNDIEVRRKNKDGTLLDVSLSTAPLYDAQDNITGIMAMMTDITERKLAGKSRRASEERYRQLFESNPHPMWVLDKETLCFLAINNAAIATYGYSKEEFLSMTIRDICSPEDIPALIEEMSDVTSGYQDTGIWRHQKKDGSPISVQITSHPISFDGRPAEIVLANDVTERLFAEEALRANEKLLRTVLETLPVGVWLVTSEGVVVKGNPAGKEIWGGEKYVGIDQYDEIKGWWADSGKRIKPEEWSAARAISKGEISLNEVIDIETFDGKRKTILSSTVPLQDSSQGIVGALVVNQDITEQKKAEEEIRRLNLELEQRVLQRTAQLEAANKELESFSYSVSHDLRAPLRHIEGFSQLLLEDYQEKLDESGKTHLQRLCRASQRMSQLIDDLLELSRVTRSELNRKQTNLSLMAQAFLLELKQSNPQRKVELKIAEDITVEADTGLLRVAMENLLGNAWKYTAREMETVIEVGSYCDNGETVYYVRDNGAGFNMQYADKLFAPFQRLHRSDEFEGNGVGLATVQRIVARHGGRIWAESAVGSGATFYFTLSGVDQ